MASTLTDSMTDRNQTAMEVCMITVIGVIHQTRRDQAKVTTTKMTKIVMIQHMKVKIKQVTLRGSANEIGRVSRSIRNPRLMRMG